LSRKRRTITGGSRVNGDSLSQALNALKPRDSASDERRLLGAKKPQRDVGLAARQVEHPHVGAKLEIE